MALSRVHNWASLEVLSASDLNAEFNNIIDNAGSLITPLTTNLDFDGFALVDLSRGTVTSPGLAFTGDTNSGLWSGGPDHVMLAAGGATAFSVLATSVGTTYVQFKRDGSINERFYPALAFGSPDDGVMSLAAGTINLVASGRIVLQASAYTNATNYLRVSPSQTGVGPLIDVAGADTNIDLNLGSKGVGHIKAATAFIPAALVSNPPPRHALVQENLIGGWIAFGFTAGAATTYASYNASVTRTGAGAYTITWDRNFLQGSGYAVFCTGTHDAFDVGVLAVQTKTAGQCTVTHAANTSGVAYDAIYMQVMALGLMEPD